MLSSAMAELAGTLYRHAVADPVQSLCELTCNQCVQVQRQRESRHQGHRHRLHPRALSPLQSTHSSRRQQQSAHCMWTSPGALTQCLRRTASNYGQPAWETIAAWGF